MAIFERGTRFGRHLVHGVLGEGRFAAVYEVTAAPGETAAPSGSLEAAPKALKVLNADIPLGAKARERFFQECAVLATLRHVHLAGYYGSGIDAGRAWHLTELVRGQNLRKLSREGGRLISIERAVNVVQQAAEGVAAAHAQGIVHRDLRPENILVGVDDLVKVVDFGSANVGGWGVKTTASERDLVGCLYAAPEWLMTKETAVSNDVYVLALVLYEVCSGQHPAAGPRMTPIEVIRHHLFLPTPPLVTLSTPEHPIPGDLSELCARGMAKDPAKRCTMREFAEGLAVVLSRIRAPLRAAARNMAETERSAALAKTERAMAASGPTGTIVMPAVPDAARAATPPPAPSPARPPERAALLPPLPQPIAVALAPVEAPGDRRSSGTPVARPAAPIPAPSRAGRVALATAATVLALGLLGTAWRFVGSGGATAARAPPDPDAAPVTASATSPPPAVSSAPAPSAQPSAPRPRVPALPARPRAPPGRSKLPFQ